MLRAALVTGATLATALVVEAALRVMAVVEDRKTLQRALEHPPDIPADRKVELGHIVRPSRNRRIVYELAPDLQVIFRDAWVTTNAQGFRGPERAPEKPAGTVRIDRWDPNTRIARGQVSESLDVIERGARVGPVGRKFQVVPPIRNEKDVNASVLAIDVGGTKMAAALVEPGGRVGAYERIVTPQAPHVDSDGLWRTLLALIEKLPVERLAGVGVGCGGPMSWPVSRAAPMPATRLWPRA